MNNHDLESTIKFIAGCACAVGVAFASPRIAKAIQTLVDAARSWF